VPNSGQGWSGSSRWPAMTSVCDYGMTASLTGRLSLEGRCALVVLRGAHLAMASAISAGAAECRS